VKHAYVNGLEAQRDLVEFFDEQGIAGDVQAE
jgi:hypothetical protein